MKYINLSPNKTSGIELKFEYTDRTGEIIHGRFIGSLDLVYTLELFGDYLLDMLPALDTSKSITIVLPGR